MDFTPITALIGCITGTISFLILLNSKWIERFNIKYELNNNNSCYFKNILTGYKSTNNAIISLNINNASSKPITIYDVYLIKNRTEYHPHYIDTDLLRIPVDKASDEYDYQIIQLANQPEFPISISGNFGTSIVLIFPFLDIDSTETLDFELVIKTNRKNKETKINLAFRKSITSEKYTQTNCPYGEYQDFINYGS